MFSYTREEITNREMVDLERYNSAVKYKKIKLANLENPYLFYDAIDKNGKCYEFKQKTIVMETTTSFFVPDQN